MTRQRHYHPLAALRFLRKAVVVCLLPLANALLEFSLNALLTALRQDAALLLFLCGASSILLEASSWALDEAGVLRLQWAFISKRERIIRGEALAAISSVSRIDLLTKPDVLGAAKAEFKEAAAAGYTCPIPPDAVPVAIED